MSDFERNLVSIITPVYNAEAFIEETIQSVLGQSYHSWELILVNDQSTDSSQTIINQYAKEDSRILILELDENSGAAVARNTGIAHAKGEFIAFIDSDDVWHPEKLEKQVAYMQNHNYAFTYTDLALVDESGLILKEKVGIPPSFSYSQLLKNTAIACSTVIINRKLIGDFRMPDVRKGQDTATWLKLMRERGVRAYGFDEVLNHYRQVKGSISSNRFAALKRTWNTYRNLEKLPLPKAIYYFSFYTVNAVLRRL